MRPIKFLIKLLLFLVFVMSLAYFIDISNLNRLESNGHSLPNLNSHASERDKLILRNIPNRRSTENVSISFTNMSVSPIQKVSFPLRWTQNTNSYPFRDSSGQYSIHQFVWTSNKWPKIVIQPLTASLATHCTISHLHHVVKLARYWDGLISVSVYTPGRDAAIAELVIEFLRRCYPNVKEFVSFHFVYPIGEPACMDFKDLDLKLDEIYIKCGDANETNNQLLQSFNFTGLSSHVKRYPQNLMRNVARKSSPTSHCITIDVDMIPSEGLSSKLTTFLRSGRLCKRCLYVVPVYELADDLISSPKNKKSLLELIESKKARQYHIEVYSKNQDNSHLELWEKKSSNDSSRVKIMYNLKKYSQFWEPIVLSHSSVPPFEERFVGYGFTRSSHIFLLFRMGYGFGVLDEAFFTHMGFQKATNYSKFRTKEIEANWKLYRIYKKEINARFNKK